MNREGGLITRGPGGLKRLESVAVVLDAAAGANTTVAIACRTDDSSSWTTAASAASSRRISAGSLGVTFYQVQFKVTITCNIRDQQQRHRSICRT